MLPSAELHTLALGLLLILRVSVKWMTAALTNLAVLRSSGALAKQSIRINTH